MPKHRPVPPALDESIAPTLGSNPTSEEVLDVAVECTFPASDPLAIDAAYDSACVREGVRRMTPR
jgi:hypothetical protein